MWTLNLTPADREVFRHAEQLNLQGVAAGLKLTRFRGHPE
jgi:hypothetical protein